VVAGCATILTSLGEYNEWCPNICKDGRGADQVLPGHYKYDMYLRCKFSTANSNALKRLPCSSVSCIRPNDSSAKNCLRSRVDYGAVVANYDGDSTDVLQDDGRTER